MTLSDGRKVSAKLVIAADGRDSTMREALGITVKSTRYGQKALAFAVTHPIPHENVSTEIHRSGGPFTLVPLPDRRWPALLCRGLDGDRARGTAPRRSAGAGVSNRDKRAIMPNSRPADPCLAPVGVADHLQIADRMTGERVALMAEAAHVVPPIGAQGLNMSLADLAVAAGACAGRSCRAWYYQNARHLPPPPPF